MLTIKLSESEYYDSSNECFVLIPETVLKLEHSLVSISKWESKYNKPFLGSDTKTNEEIYYYIKCMITNFDDVDDILLNGLTPFDTESITSYIQAPMTATTVRQSNGKASREVITSELIYYWMVSFTIPFECERWHLNRLLMLINVCNAKNAPATKEKPKETLSRNAALNAARKKSMQTSG